MDSQGHSGLVFNAITHGVNMFAIGFTIFCLSYLLSLFIDDDDEITDEGDNSFMFESVIAMLYVSGIILMVGSAAQLLWQYLP